MRHLRTVVLISGGGVSLRISVLRCLQDPEAGPAKAGQGHRGAHLWCNCILLAAIASLRLPVMSCHESCGDIPVVRIESSLYCADI